MNNCVGEINNRMNYRGYIHTGCTNVWVIIHIKKAKNNKKNVLPDEHAMGGVRVTNTVPFNQRLGPRGRVHSARGAEDLTPDLISNTKPNK